MSAPLVSILMLSYNHEPFVGKAIESVLAQTFQDWRLVLVDDCSPDGSWEVISRYDDPRIEKERFGKNRGAGAAYETARAKCGGEFLAHLDSDDAWEPEKLERQIAYLKSNPGVDICCTGVTEVNATDDAVWGDYAEWFNGAYDPEDPAAWLWANRVCHSSILMRRALHDRVGALNADLIHTPDWDLWCRCLDNGARFGILKEPLTRYRGHSSNITRKNPMLAFREHAYTCATSLHPWFYRSGRADLAGDSVRLFICTPRFAELAVEERVALLELICGRQTTKERFRFLCRDGVFHPVPIDRTVAVDPRMLASVAKHHSYTLRLNTPWLELVVAEEDGCATMRHHTDLVMNQTQAVSVYIPGGVGKKRVVLEIPPVGALITIESATARCARTNAIVWEPAHTELSEMLTVRSSARPIPCNWGFHALIADQPALIALPCLPAEARFRPLRLEFTIRVSSSLAELPSEALDRLLTEPAEASDTPSIWKRLTGK